MPRRFWILGSPGAGKTTLARALGERTGAPVVSIDELNWRPGWRETPRPELRHRLDEAIRGPAWVVEGNYGSIREHFLDRVDLFVWLDLPFFVSFRRLLVRTVVRSVTGRTCCNGNRESLRQAFLTRDSILLWAIRRRRPQRRQFREQLRSRPHVRLRSSAAVSAWLASLPDRR